MECTLAVFCDYANVSQEGKLNILGVFGEINPPGLPIALPQMFLVVSYTAEPVEYDTVKHIKMAIINADATVELVSIEQDITVPRPPRPGLRSNINQIIGLAGVTFPTAGDYSLEVLVGGEPKRSVPLIVNPPPAQAQGGR